MSYMRTLGNNIHCLLLETYGSIENSMSPTGYTLIDLKRICEGRIAFTPSLLKDLSVKIGVSIERIMNIDNLSGKNVNCIECMGEFSNAGDQDKILDIIDDYIFLREQVSIN